MSDSKSEEVKDKDQGIPEPEKKMESPVEEKSEKTSSDQQEDVQKVDSLTYPKGEELPAFFDESKIRADIVSKNPHFSKWRIEEEIEFKRKVYNSRVQERKVANRALATVSVIWVLIVAVVSAQIYQSLNGNPGSETLLPSWLFSFQK